MSIDQKAMVKDIFKGFAVPQYGPIPATPKNSFYDAAAEPVIPFSPTAAKKLLEKHGWTEKNGVMTNAKGQQLNFTLMYVSGVQSILDQAQLMQADWATVGIKTTLKGENFNEFLTIGSNKHSNAWQIAVGSGWDYNGPGWYPSGQGLFNTNAANGSGYSNPHEDALVNATAEPYATPAQTMKVFDQYEAYTASQLPMLWLPNPAAINVASPKVHGAETYANPATANPAYNYMSLSQ